MHGAQIATVRVLGGTGVVGQNLARVLRAPEADQVATVSRNPLQDGTAHLVRNLADPQSDIPCARVDIVVNLSGQTPVAVAGTVIRRGAVFIERSASPNYVMASRGMARSAKGPAFLAEELGPACDTVQSFLPVRPRRVTQLFKILRGTGAGKSLSKRADPASARCADSRTGI